MTEIFRNLCRKRGITKEFLEPEYRPDFYPDLPDLKKAVERILTAVKEKEKILIYGDYDADGITASTVMLEGLKLVGAEEVEVMLPDRFKDGYGMGERVVERAISEKVKLVITVDCGSNNAEVVKRLMSKGVEVVVTDHHEVSGELPEEVAVVNPKREDAGAWGDSNGEQAKTEEGRKKLKELAGVGVAFMVVRGMVRAGAIPDGQEKWLLDLVLIGTLCDSMEMTGINRELGFYGMKVLIRTRRVGLIELIKIAGMKEITAEAIGFFVGPRINAAGRMASPEVAFSLINTSSKAEAVRLAGELNELNEARKKAQGAAVKEIMERGVGEESVIVASGEWHEGVLGIVAGRLTEEYKKPAFALAETEPGVLKGSGRSFGDFNLAKALLKCQNTIVGGGGHMSACGVKVLKEKLEEFRRAVNEYYESLGLREQEKFLSPKADLTVENMGEFSVELVEEMRQLEPYGPGNTEPVFLIKQAEVLEVRRMGEEGKHLRLTIKGARGGVMKLLAFYAPKEWLEMVGGERVDVWVGLSINEWNGMRNVEGKILELVVSD